MADMFEKAKGMVSRSFIESRFGTDGARWEGRNFKTCSPLRDDRTPGSFSIREDGVYYDYVTGDSGDMIDLLSKVSGQSAREVALSMTGGTTTDTESRYTPEPEPEAEIELSWMPIPNTESGSVRKPKFRMAPDYLTLFHINDIPAFYVARYNGSDSGKKIIYPIYWTGSVFKKGLPSSIKNRPLALFDKDKTVVVVEGEKCMERARAAMPAYSWTTWHGGAGAVKKIDLHDLAGCDVVIWPDNDEPGARAADHIMNILGNACRSLRRIDVPYGKPKGWDVADAIEEGENVNLILEEAVIVDSGTPDEVQSVDSIGIEPRRAAARPYTDLGNAERFCDIWGHSLRYNLEKNKWLIWMGGRWKDGDQTIVTPMVKHAIRSIAIEDDRKESVFWARKSESSKSIGAMLSLAQKERGVPVHEYDLDRDPFIMNCPNGMVDLRSGKLLEPEQERLCTKVTKCNYVPGTDAPLWRKFLEETFMEDPGLLNFIQRWIGYSLTADTSAQTFAIFYGIGANGKSTLVETVRKVAGDYVRIAPPDTFIQKQAGGVPNDIAALRGARMVLTTETEANARLAESKVKSMTGGEEISARYMRGEFFEFTPTWKIIISTNHKPRISGGDYGIWRRVALVPFDNVVPPDKQDPRLMSKLAEEAEGILAWAVAGARMWFQDGGGRVGLQVPQAVYENTQEYREDEDVIGRFILEGCMKADEIRSGVQNRRLVKSSSSATEVLYSFRAWAEKEGESGLAKISSNAMGRALRERGYNPDRTSSGKRYEGIVPYDLRTSGGSSYEE